MGLAVKAASIFGPLTYGAVTLVFAGNHRLGIFVTGLYFVIGLLLLRRIDVERGGRARQALDQAASEAQARLRRLAVPSGVGDPRRRARAGATARGACKPGPGAKLAESASP